MLLVSGLSVLMLSGAVVSPPMANAGNSVIEQTKNSVNKKKISGTVIDETGMPMIGVTVRVQGTSSGYATDLEGRFTLDVPENATLVFSYIGYEDYTLKVDSRNAYTVKMQTENEALDEVVVIGYQTIKRRDLTGSVASVTGDAIASMPVSNIAQAMQGKLPGVNITSQDDVLMLRCLFVCVVAVQYLKATIRLFL